MQKFNVKFCSIQQIRSFVALSAKQPFPVTIGNDRQEVSAKSFIGIFGLDGRKPMWVTADCTEEEFRHFQQSVSSLLAG